MALRITESSITSDGTAHTARISPDGWQVSWLPGRTLTRNQAVSALMLTQEASRGIEQGDRLWPHVTVWAGELGLLPRDAVALASASEIEDKELGQ